MNSRKISVLYDILKTISTLALAILLAFGFEQLGINKSNILLVFVLAILFISIETKKAIYALVSSLFCTLFFNFFFTVPKYSLVMDDANYYITLAIFLVVSIIISILTTRIKRQITSLKENEKRSSILYDVSIKLLDFQEASDIIEYIRKEMSDYLNRQVIFYIKNEKVILFGAKEEDLSEDLHISLEYAAEHGIRVGKNESMLSNLDYVIFPVAGKSKIRGSIAVKCFGKDILSKANIEFVNMIIANMIISLEKDVLLKEKELANLEVENEKFKNALLRSLSHDIKTPLTTLQTGSSFLLDSYDKVDDNSKKKMLKDMNSETIRLSEFVDNLLSLTKISSNKLLLDKKNELVEDILATVSSHVSNRLEAHQLIIKPSEEMLYVYSDSRLLVQVLTNLVDNAIIHTNKNCYIELSYYEKNDSIYFLVCDNGGGIKEEDLPNVFTEFNSIKKDKQDKYRGSGLGLNICKAIVEAHGGTISAMNNDVGGATFAFNIPNQSKEKTI